ncbi:polyhydroxyalkanoate synthesis regulator DNA-binding domain-containing protein [Candidatus Viridilinea mediisalina]|uniref:Pesticidal protein Cry15Aa n=1 Tax=Candidatus Viridilinea mediisalina TaxID=2024553 RepID=A0A2A6RFR5_9CHLR|nr:polyhydroxyalkanoate synthesis regulator DNA-binding domain-containing protein [Candidatus Viridilinea mediisalina]PDW01700.1 pesticidal protein Cry15Aa [Candidatus Viridilinea mediisalina]
MQLIKKYANRKLYHTNQKQYITLEGIARLVQQGEPVQVLENETGEDITAGILAQVVLQARGRTGAQLPTQLLTGLIQIGGDTIANLRRNLVTSIGGADVIDAEITRRIDHLVEHGMLSSTEAQRWHQLLTQTDFGPSEQSSLLDPVPNRNDVVRLHSQVDALSQVIDELLRERA